MPSIDSDRVTHLLRDCIPSVDDAIVDYVLTYLRDPHELDDDDDQLDSTPLAHFLTPILVDAGGDETAIDALCKQLEILCPQTQATHSSKPSKLDQPLQMMNDAQVSATAKFALGGSTDLEWIKGRKGISMVDGKKLEKAEAKIRQKMEKRERKMELYEASRLITKSEEKELLLRVNPVLDYTSTRGKSKDIKVENFDISFSGKRILTDTTLTLPFGRRYGLIGRNGIGKSTLLRTISRREIDIPTHISILHVEQEMHGDETRAIDAVLSADIWREHLLEEERRITHALQQMDGDTQESDQRDALVAELNQVHAKLVEIESDKAESKAGMILNGLGFSPEQYVWPTKSFSGGWRMRLALARALFCKPDLLLLDEPTNMLDIPAVAWLEAYLKKWPNTLLVVSHDREFLDEVATDILHQHSERLDYYKGNFTQFDATRSERRKNQLREYEAQMQYRKHLQDFVDRWRYNANRAAQAQSKIKILEKLPELELPEEEHVVTFRFPDPDALSPPILQMSNMEFGYDQGKTLLSGVFLDVQLDARIAVVGPNGAGKTTMLKVLTGQLHPRQGIVHRHGRLRIAYFSQHHVDQLELDVSAVSFMAKKWPGKPEEEYRRQLGRFGISGMVGLQQMETLSGGQKSRVAFAMLAMRNPHIIIMDEPTNHLDMDSIEALTRALKEFKGGVCVVSHDERFIDSVCTELWVCADGKVSKFEGDGIKAYKRQIVPDE
jgi:ATP-binding cassette subfamily F protein 3